MGILEWLGLSGREPAAAPGRGADADTVRRIASALEQLEPERARFLGALAFVLSRVAHADLDISADETAAMQRIVAEWGELPEEQAALAVEIAKGQSRLFGSTDGYLATRELKELMTTREQKQRLLQCLFAVSAADDSITNVEEQEIRQIAAELGLTHEEFVSTRALFRDKRELLRGKP